MNCRVFMRSGWICLWICFGMIHGCLAQRITQVRFEQFGRAIQVHYALERLPYDSFATLNLFVSTNGGQGFKGPLVRVQGDIGRVESNGLKSVIWEVMEEYGELDGMVAFEIRGEVQRKDLGVENLLMYNVSGSSGIGLMYGRVARWGAYVRGKTNLSFEDAPYTCDNSGEFDYEGKGDYYVVDKEVRRSRFGVTAGVLYRPYRFLYVYAGAGYGFRRLMWHARTYDYDDEGPTGELWAVNTRRSSDGLEMELGAIYRYRRLAVSAGVNTVAFSFFELNGAIGLFF